MPIKAGIRSVCNLMVVGAIAVITTHPAVATPVTFAQYFQADGSQQQWTISTSGGTTTVSASGPVLFAFSAIPGLPISGLVDATFALSATSGQLGDCGTACGAGDTFVQHGYTGAFSFLDNDAGAYFGANLLSGTFAVSANPSLSGAQFSAHLGSGSGSFDATTVPGNLDQVLMTSLFLDLSNQDQQDASWSLSSLIPDFAVGVVNAGRSYPSGPFTAAGAGTFSSSPGPTADVPEPNTLNLIGVGILGFIARRKRPVQR